MNFEKLARVYEEETDMHSSSGPMERSSAFPHLVQMGPPVIGLILQRMFDRAGSMCLNWIIVIRAIDPDLPPHKAGDEKNWPSPEGIKQTWREWGIAKGYLRG